MDAEPHRAPAVETVDLTRVFRVKPSRRNPKGRTVTALGGVTLRVEEGECFGVLGPNGAGKTTLIKILSTLLLPTSGKAYVCGIDVARDPFGVKQRINIVSGGESGGYGILSVRESLWMFSQFYGLPNKLAFERIDRMLKLVGLEDDAGTLVSKLSTGMRQKMNFIRGFLSDPDVLFLDEPTLGLDVTTARTLRKFVREWMAERPGRTILLTTHYMAEADELCDRVAIIDRGKILACDTPANLKRRIAREAVLRLEVAHADGNGLSPADLGSLKAQPGVREVAARWKPEVGRTQLTAILEGDGAIPELVRGLSELGLAVHALTKEEPTLEDVFVELVGRSLAEDTPAHDGDADARAAEGEGARGDAAR